jgi:hypothetical protein
MLGDPADKRKGLQRRSQEQFLAVGKAQPDADRNLGQPVKSSFVRS